MSREFDTITIAQVARMPRPGTTVPGAVSFTRDGRAVTYLFSEDGTLIRSLWRYALDTGERTVLAGPPPASTSEQQLSREEELRRERARLRDLGVTSYEWATSAEPPVLMVPAGGKLYVSVGGGGLRELEGIDGAIDPHLSGDGSMVAFVRGGELFVAPVSGGLARQLSSGAEDGLTNGLAEFIAQEELDRDRGFWWNDAATHIAYIQADSRHIPDYPIVHQGEDGFDIEHHRYPFAGQPNAHVDLAVVEVASGATVWMGLGTDRDIYIAGVAWRPDGVLTAQVLSRDQKTLQLIAFDAASGAATVLIEERCEPWVNLSHDARFLESGELLWSSEKSGFRHLHLHGPRGEPLRQLTAGEWVVTGVACVDEERRMVYFSGTRDGVLERHIYAVSLDGGDVHRVTREPGWHSAVFARDGRRFVDTWSSLQHGPRVAVREADGTLQAELFLDEGATAEALGLRPPEFLEVKAPNGSMLHGSIYRPIAEGEARFPLIVSVYGGPHVQRVADEWSLTVDLRAQYLAREGYAVLKLDNRGSSNRGLLFEGALAGRMGTVEVEDQVAAVEQLSRLPYVDGSRVGIYGWSYGGYMTCMAMLREPELFKVGVAGAPVTDWDGYDTGYTERYMGTPQSNAEGYRDSSVLTHAGRLRGKLLLVHGMTDENVHFRHTARLIVALTQAEKDYDLLIFPEERHMPRDAKGMEYQERRVIQYFKDHL